jgi:predicted GIY-YIG superfamily endonuclease
MEWYVYILRCSDDSFYVGHTDSVERRFVRHTSATGAKHTATHKPERIEYEEALPSKLDAIRRERQIKRWSREKKQALIDGDIQRLKALSRSHDHK